MLATGIVLGVLLILAMLRFGASVEYCEDGFNVTARAGPIRYCVYPRKPKPKREKKPKEKKAHKVKEKKEEPVTEKPGTLETVRGVLADAVKTLGRLRRRLLISNLRIWYIAAGDDPSKTAISFGRACAAYGGLLPILENNFRIKHRDLRASVDFDLEEPGVYVYAVISLAVWEAVYIVASMIPLILKIARTSKKPGDRKDRISNGQTPDQ